MEVKKKTFLENLRLKTKLPNLRKPGKKPLSKQGRQLANRRSISVPDLRLVPGETTRSALLSTESDNISVGVSPRMSDTDSVASGSVTDGPIFRMDRLNDSFPEVTPRVHKVYAAAAMNRISAPAAMNRISAPDAMKRVSAPEDILALYEETECMMNLERMGNLPEEALYAQVNKKSKGSGQIFTLDPVPAPRSVFNNAQNIYLPRPDRTERGSVSGEDTSGERLLPSSLAAALARAHSLGEQSTPNTDRRVKPVEQRKAISENRTPPVSKRKAIPQSMFLTLDALGAPLESVYGTSPDSASGTPSEERVSGPWATDSEELDLCFPTMMRRVSTEEALLEETRDEEAQGEETRDDEALQEIGEMSSETFEFFEENVQDPTDNSQATGSEVQEHFSFQRYLLSINLKQGRNLVIKHKRSGTSDPYVKFRIEGKQIYKSKVVYKNLNPRWNETFSHALRDREHLVEVRVYDKNRTADEFMGSSSISLKNLELYKTYEMELHLEDPKSKGDELGVVFVDFCLMFRDATIKRSPRWPPRKNKQNQAAASQRLAEPQRSQPKNQMWSGMLSITLVEGQDLPQYGHGDVYVRFRLGDQKYKSKNLCIQANPQWREQFDFNQFDDNQEPLQVEVYWKRGRKGEESWGMFEVDLSRLSFNERHLNTHVLNPGKGRLVFLVTLRPCWGVSISDIEIAALEKSDERHTIVERFSLKNSHKCVGEVGFLQVKVIKANDLHPTDLNGKTNPLCVIELGNSKLQTHTIYKTVNPEWNKALTFPIKDIHDVMELTVLDENGDKTPSFLGKVAIPLLSIQNGQQICPYLKKEDLGRASKGTITLVLDVIYNKVRAGVRTFKPEETKLMEENLKFSKKVLARNIYRVRKISTAVLYTLQYIKSCFQWESTQRSLIAFLIFLVTVWHWELFMLPLFLLLLIGWNYFQLSTGKASSNQDLVNMSMGDDEEEEEKESGKKGLMDKIHMVQEVVLVVQTVLDEIANIGERFKNIFNWSVPFMSCMTCLVLSVTTALLYFVPLRYIVLIWGVNKFTKKLRNPYSIDNNEILDFLKRVPSDVQKVQYRVLRAPTSQGQPRRKR